MVGLTALLGIGDRVVPSWPGAIMSGADIQKSPIILGRLSTLAAPALATRGD
jgi:hypothetical protein